MKSDPAKTLTVTNVTRPALRGAGSGKDAWVAFANDMARSTDVLFQTTEDQSNLIEQLQTEVARLKAHIASRKPKGGRPATPDNLADLIKADLARGYSQRAAAVRNGVSAMTVSRLARGEVRLRATI